VNLIKSTFKEAVESPDLKDNIINTSVGLATGYLSKLLFVNVSHSPIRKLLGIALQFGITQIVAKNPEAVKSFGKKLMKIISPKSATNSLKEHMSMKTTPDIINRFLFNLKLEFSDRTKRPLLPAHVKQPRMK
jgi:hypothetical protein